MMVWDFSGFDQRFGSATCFSIAANCCLSLSASKILPQVANFIFQGSVFLF